MSKNRFLHNYASKSNAELLKIVGNSDYQEEAQHAATWELESREKVACTEEEDTNERITFTTEKKETRLFLLLIMSVFALLLRFSYRKTSGLAGKYESIFDVIGLLMFVAIMIYTIVRSIKKMSTINESFEISDYSLIINKGESTFKFDAQNKPSSISRSLNELAIKDNDGNEMKVNLENYSLSYSQSKLLTRKVEELQKNWFLLK